MLYSMFAVITDPDRHSALDLLRSLTLHFQLYRQRLTNDSFRFVIIITSEEISCRACKHRNCLLMYWKFLMMRIQH